MICDLKVSPHDKKYIVPDADAILVIRAHRALRYLTAAADSGHTEAGREASKAYAMLANIYREKYDGGQTLREI